MNRLSLKIIGIAQKESLKSDVRSTKHGAVIFKNDMILGKGCNTRGKYYAYNQQFTIHAEVVAVIRCLKRHNRNVIRGSSVLVYRENGEGISNSKPCTRCTNILKSIGIVSIYYTTKSGIEKIWR